MNDLGTWDASRSIPLEAIKRTVIEIVIDGSLLRNFCSWITINHTLNPLSLPPPPHTPKASENVSVQNIHDLHNVTHSKLMGILYSSECWLCKFSSATESFNLKFRFAQVPRWNIRRKLLSQIDRLDFIFREKFYRDWNILERSTFRDSLLSVNTRVLLDKFRV